MQSEFQEIGHSGGKVTFTVVTDASGIRKYQIGWSGSRPVPAAIFAVWAYLKGLPSPELKWEALAPLGILRLCPGASRCSSAQTAKANLAISVTRAVVIGVAMPCPSCARIVLRAETATCS